MTTEKFASVFIFGLALIFVSPILGVLVGAGAGWVVGLVFEDAIIGFLNRLGVETAGLTMWQVGASLGFIGGYLKTTVHQKS